MKLVYDISRPIAPSSVVYPGDAPPELSTVCEIGDSAPCHIMNLGLTTHFGTHVDVPAHFIRDGKTLDDVQLHRFGGPAVVVEVEGDTITAAHIPAIEKSVNVLFKTNNSRQQTNAEFKKDHVYVTEEAAEALAARGVNMVGIDYLSVDRFGDENYPVHKLLLGRGVLILEGLDLSDVSAGRYHLSAFPLRIAGGDGSPVRATLEVRW